MSSLYSKSFSDLLDSILTDYRNQFPAADTSQGTLLFVKSACLASAVWGLYKYQDWISRQIFPDTADSQALEHHAYLFGLTRAAGETDAALLARLLSRIRRPPAGGNRYDYEAWAVETAVAAGTRHQPGAAMLSSFGVDTFSAAAALDSDTDTVAWATDTSVAGAWVRVDCGAGYARQFTGCRLYLTQAGYAGVWSVQYSDDGSSWTDANTGWTPSAAGWNARAWSSVGVRRYWRLYLTTASDAGPDISEMEWSTGAESCVEAVCIPAGQGPGTVDVVIAGSVSDGLASDTLREAVLAHIDDVRPVTAYETRVLAATLTRQAVEMTVYGDVDTARVGSDVAALLASLRIGQTLYRAQLVSISMGLGASNVVVTTPASDVSVGASGLVRASGTPVILEA